MKTLNEKDLASSVLGKIGNGTVDADFARCIGDCVDAVKTTHKKAKLVLVIEVQPRDDMGCIELRADVSTKLPKLPAPASQMHVGPNGELLSQMEFMFGGGPEETPRPVPQGAASSASGRMTVAKAPTPGPVAAAPAPAPLKTGKETAGKEA